MIWNSICLVFVGKLLSQTSRENEYHIISISPEAKKFNWYCGVKSYSRKEQKPEYNIEKVIVIHRHGDRTPIAMARSKWSERRCISCVYGKDRRSIGPCAEKECESGDLTMKGYKQLKKLGKFIKDQYRVLLGAGDSLDGVELRATLAPRTHSSLFGLVNGIKKIERLENVNIPTDDSLIVPENCRRLDEVMKAQGRELYKEIRTSKQSIDPVKIADNYWTHMCNDVAINCSELDCSEETIWKYLNASTRVWKEQSKVVDENESLLKILFGKFANELSKIIANDTHIHIYSAHDGSLSSVLAGVGARVYERPPYASAVFIERWADKNKSRFVRVVYNGRVCKTLIDDDTNIPLDKFLKYIKILAVDSGDLHDLCMLSV